MRPVLLLTLLWFVDSVYGIDTFRSLSWTEKDIVERQLYAVEHASQNADHYEYIQESFQFHLDAPSDVNIPEYELEALHDLYNSTNGADWRWSNLTDGIPWTFTVDANPCRDNWQGVKCALSGTPSAQIKHVVDLNLRAHYLKGSLPDSLGNLTMLNKLTLFINRINGTLPRSLGRLTQLTYLDLSENWISGTIPQTFENLRNLSTFFAGSNFLSGTIPDVFASYTNLTRLGFAGNCHTGTLPHYIANLTQLNFLDVSNNFLNGTIPNSYGNLWKMNFMWLSNNSFTGTLPTTLCNLTHMKYLYVNSNKLHGTIPTNINTMTDMSFLDLGGNSFTGTIPTGLSALSKLVFFGCYENQLVSTIPNFLTTLSELRYLYMYSNAFTGTIPHNLGDLRHMLFLFMQKNKLHGPIPSNIGNMHRLLQCYLYDNTISGTLPVSIGNMSHLQYLYLQSNRLSGTVPIELSHLSSLVSILLEDNMFIGDLNNAFNPTIQQNLTTITLSDNQFTGTLPDAVFLLPQLSTFVGVNNCFTGRLKEIMCNSTKIIALALDGMQSAKTCRVTLLPHISTSYLSDNSIRSTIPLCLFTLPRLNTLHLSGNGLTGSLPEHMSISNNLFDLSLSHNVLTGSIPLVIQQRTWYNLDLSYNRFTGALLPPLETQPINFTYSIRLNPTQSKNYTKDASTLALGLENNRLSGEIPDTVLNIHNISILNGNLFSCDFGKTNLPQYDNGQRAYECASNSFDVPYYVWLCMLGIGVLLCVFLFTRSLSWQKVLHIPNVRELVYTWLDATRVAETIIPNNMTGHKLQREATALACSIYTALLRIALTCCAFILLVLLPIYVVLSDKYGTHTHQYAWAVSAAFLSGATPFYVILSFWLMFLVVLVVAYHSYTRQFTTIEKRIQSHRIVIADLSSEADSFTYALHATRFESFSVHVVFVLINFTIVLGVNIGFVYVALYESTVLLVFAQILLSFFKIVWNSVCSRYLIRYIVYHCAPSTRATHDATMQYFPIQLFVALFNNIAIPCLVVSVISPNCFYNLLVAAEAVNSRYDYAKCELQDFSECIFYEPQVASTSYNPPFTYSYQCSSSFITYYAPAFVYLCITVAFLNPTLFFTLAYVHKHTSSTSCVHSFVNSILPRIWKPLPATDRGATHTNASIYTNARCTRASSSHQTAVSSITDGSISYPTVIDVPDEFEYTNNPAYNTNTTSKARNSTTRTAYNDLESEQQSERTSQLSIGENISSITSATHTVRTTHNTTHNTAKPTRDLFQSYFDANLVLITLLTFLGIMLTFGVVFPPLGVALAVTIFSVVYVSKLKIGRFLCLAQDSNLLQYVRIIEKECRSIGSTRILINSVWMLVLFSCWFYSLFLFDTIGDQRGFKDSFWVLIVMALMPIMLFVVYNVRTFYATLCAILYRTPHVSESGEVYSVEMRQTVSTKTNSMHVSEEVINALAEEERDSESNA